MATRVPAYSFSGQSSAELKGGYWYIYLKSSGMLKMSYRKTGVQAFLVGGGGSGTRDGIAGGGGGGGYTATIHDKTLAAGQEYAITVGAGGKNSDGESTSALGTTVEGGKKPDERNGGNGGSGGGGGGYSASGDYQNGAPGGSDGGNGTAAAYRSPGIGQGTTTRAFGEADGELYAGGGGGGGGGPAKGGAGGAGGGGNGGSGDDAIGENGDPNTGGGGGGGGGDYAMGGEGGSGIVILRGTQDDFLPVYFRGTQLSEIYLNGQKLGGLIYGGTRIFARAMKSWRKRLRAENPQPLFAAS